MIDDTLPPIRASLIGEVFASASSLATADRGLPLANVEQPPRRPAVHSIRIVDGNGRIGDRVLLAADLDLGLLVVYPAQVLDEILARRFAEGGGR